MRVPLLRGRDVAESDTEVMLVSRGAAKLLWGDADPIGRRVTLPLQSKTLLKQVIGIVGDVKQGDLSEPPMATVYEYTHERDWPGPRRRRAGRRCHRHRSRRPPPPRCTRSILNSRCRTSGRWTKCSTRR